MRYHPLQQKIIFTVFTFTADVGYLCNAHAVCVLFSFPYFETILGPIQIELSMPSNCYVM
jgi:hypothetical protein